MALATTCPRCSTSFKVVPDQLKLRRGLVRCGVCQHVFSGIDFLRYVDESGRLDDGARVTARAAAPSGTADIGPDGGAIVRGTSTDEAIATGTWMVEPGAAPLEWRPSAEPSIVAHSAMDTIAAAGRAAEGEPAAALEPASGVEPASDVEPGSDVEPASGVEPDASAEAQTAAAGLEEEIGETWSTGLDVPEAGASPAAGMDLAAPGAPDALHADEAAAGPETQAEDALTTEAPDSHRGDRPEPDPRSRTDPVRGADVRTGPDFASDPGADLDMGTAAGTSAGEAARLSFGGAGEATAPPRRHARTHQDAHTGTSEGEDAIDFFATDRRSRGFDSRAGVLHTLAAVLLTLAALTQATIAGRDRLAAWFPQLGAPLSALVRPLGLSVAAPRDLDALTIEAFELRPGDGANLLTMSALLRNHSQYMVRWPAMELSLIDAGGSLAIRKVLQPSEYLAPAGRVNDPGIGALAEFSVRVVLRARDVEATGYTVHLFYP